MQDKNNQGLDNIIRVLEKLDLSPILQENQGIYAAACPNDRTHQMIADSRVNHWECKTCSIGGGILELSYHNSLSEIKSLNESILNDVDELNAFLGVKLNIREINESTLLQFHSSFHKHRLQGVIHKKELFQQEFRMLNQYRLSIMVQDLKEGKESNDDIRKWWANRY